MHDNTVHCFMKPKGNMTVSPILIYHQGVKVNTYRPQDSFHGIQLSQRQTNNSSNYQSSSL